MAISMANERSKQIMERLIRNDFDKVDLSLEYIYNASADLIMCAKYYGLNSLAKEMEADLLTEISFQFQDIKE